MNLMPKFGQKSIQKLEQADPRLQRICSELIKEFDFTVIHTYRTPEEQLSIYKKGRKLIAGKWTKVGTTFTNLDGKTKKSFHNYLPSYAIDIYPYPIDLKDTNRFNEMGKRFKEIATKMDIPIEWGGDWKMRDLGHFQIPKKNWNDNIEGMF